MQAPRRLYHAADRKTIVEEDDPRAAFLLIGKGQMISDADARRLGLLRYLEHPPEAATAVKAIELTPDEGIEHKAVDQDETENKGIFPPESKRSTGGARR